MWTVMNGAMVYVPKVAHVRSALGIGYVVDVLTLMERAGVK